MVVEHFLVAIDCHCHVAYYVRMWGYLYVRSLYGGHCARVATMWRIHASYIDVSKQRLPRGMSDETGRLMAALEVTSYHSTKRCITALAYLNISSFLSFDISPLYVSSL